MIKRLCYYPEKLASTLVVIHNYSYLIQVLPTHELTFHPVTTCGVHSEVRDFPSCRYSTSHLNCTVKLFHRRKSNSLDRVREPWRIVGRFWLRLITLCWWWRQLCYHLFHGQLYGKCLALYWTLGKYQCFFLTTTNRNCWMHKPVTVLVVFSYMYTTKKLVPKPQTHHITFICCHLPTASGTSPLLGLKLNVFFSEIELPLDNIHWLTAQLPSVAIYCLQQSKQWGRYSV